MSKFVEGFKEGINQGLSTGMGPFSLLGVAFIIMKLAGVGAVASWSWWWVTMPFWGPTVIILALILLTVISVTTIVAGASLWKSWKARG